MHAHRFLTLLLGALLTGSCGSVSAQRSLVNPELLRNGDENGFVQTILFEFPQATKGAVHVKAFQWRGPQDSLLIYELRTETHAFGAGASSRTWKLDQRLKDYKTDPGFAAVLRRFGTVPPGVYNIYVSIDTGAAVPYAANARYMVDSNLAPNTRLRNMLNSLFGAGGRNAKTALREQARDLRADAPAAPASADGAGASARMRRSFRSLKGLETRTVRLDGTVQSELFYEDWFLGRYKLADARSMTASAEAEYRSLQENAASKVERGLEGFRSVGSQVRELYTQSEDRNLRGDIDMSFSSATGRDPYSSLDPTFADIHGVVSAEIKGIPVSVDGYYTTQDMNREAKASYFRFQYDAQKAKDKLMKLVGDYRSKFTETAAGAAGMEQVYGQYRDNLKKQAGALVSSTVREYGVDETLMQDGAISREALLASLARKIDTASLMREARSAAVSAAAADSSCTAIRERYAAAREKLEASGEEIRKRQRQYAEMQQKIEKYSAMLEQYRTQVSLDSAINYAPLEKLRAKDASCKDIAKAAEGLLPDGKVRKAITGLTHLEGGILSRYESEYTLAGQTLKGISGGYDIGVATIGGAAGYTEYVNREGRVDRYFGYLGRVDLKEHAGQKLSFMYYGYSPTRQVLRTSHFAGNVEAAYPTFARPVQVLAVTHAGKFGRDLHWQSEVAASLQQGAVGQTVGWDNTALKSAADYAIPQTGVSLKGEWEHLGRNFENRSLPLSRAGTERYTAGASGDFLRNFLHLALTFNYLEQRNLSSTGYNTRWGFELRTRSKRYPNVQVAYRPFSTFRAVSDTLAVSQRPLFGEVRTAQASYQIKRRGGTSHRFSLSYNRNATTNDTLIYRSVTAQAGYLYADKNWMASLNGGWMELPMAAPEGYSSGSSCFVSASGARAFGRITAHAAQDLALAPFGLQRLSTTAGAAYKLKTAPLSLRLTLRYTHYRQDAVSPAGSLLAAQLGFGWHFSVPLSDKTDKI